MDLAWFSETMEQKELSTKRGRGIADLCHKGIESETKEGLHPWKADIQAVLIKLSRETGDILSLVLLLTSPDSRQDYF